MNAPQTESLHSRLETLIALARLLERVEAPAGGRRRPVPGARQPDQGGARAGAAAAGARGDPRLPIRRPPRSTRTALPDLGPVALAARALGRDRDAGEPGDRAAQGCAARWPRCRPRRRHARTAALRRPPASRRRSPRRRACGSGPPRRPSPAAASAPSGSASISRACAVIIARSSSNARPAAPGRRLGDRVVAFARVPARLLEEVVGGGLGLGRHRLAAVQAHAAAHVAGRLADRPAARMHQQRAGQDEVVDEPAVEVALEAAAPRGSRAATARRGCGA